LRQTYGEVGGELGSDNTVGSVVAGDLAPDDAELVSLCLVDVGDLLAVVEVSALLVLNTVDLDQVGVVVCVAATSVITGVTRQETFSNCSVIDISPSAVQCNK
jgi:hypothetical protein